MFTKVIAILVYLFSGEGAIIRNEKIDRVEKDWNNNKGRAVIFDVLKSELH